MLSTAIRHRELGEIGTFLASYFCLNVTGSSKIFVFIFEYHIDFSTF